LLEAEEFVEAVDHEDVLLDEVEDAEDVWWYRSPAAVKGDCDDVYELVVEKSVDDGAEYDEMLLEGMDRKLALQLLLKWFAAAPDDLVHADANFGAVR
jgi:hypothetical protein